MSIFKVDNTARDLDERVVRSTVALVSGLRAEQLSRPTPCAAWDLRRLLEHRSTQHRGFAAAARGDGADLANWNLPATHADPVSDYLDAAETVLAAFVDVEPTALVEIGEFGPDAVFPAARALTFHFLDCLVHGWDVARSVGRQWAPAADLVEAGWEVAATIPVDEESRPAGGPFDNVVPVPDGPFTGATSFDRLLAHVGRTPW